MPPASVNDLNPVARIEAMDAAALQQHLVDASGAEEAVLRLYLGDETYRRLRDLAFTAGLSGRPRRDHVVVIPSILGTVLGAQRAGGQVEPVWISAPAIAQGALEDLRLSRDGTRADTAVSLGIMKRYYGELMLTLLRRWQVHSFSYDWRQDMRSSAEQLESQLRKWFGYAGASQATDDSRPRVHLVAHGAGGLVARAFVHLYPERWRALRGKLVLAGVPNRGSLTILQTLCGASPIVRDLAAIDSRHDVRQLQQILASFPSFYQMLPNQTALNGVDVFDPALYHGLPEVAIDDALLDGGREFAAWLASPAGDATDRMVCVLGSNQVTARAVLNRERMDQPEAYAYGLDGDGLTPYDLTHLAGVDSWYFDGHYADLVAHPAAIRAIEALLLGQSSDHLTREPAPSAVELGDAIKHQIERRARKAVEFERLRQTLAHPKRGNEDHAFTIEQRDLETLLVRDVLSSPKTVGRSTRIHVPFDPPAIEIRLLCGDIAGVDGQAWDLPIDAVAVGSYMGVKPQSSLKDLDLALSRVLSGRRLRTWEPADGDLFLTSLVARGALRPNLGEVFVIDDPRQAKGASPRRSVVVAGMGRVGRFGSPELAILVRELCWMVGRLGKNHLVAVPIGGGSGVMSRTELAQAWVRGIKYAITGVGPYESSPCLRRVTLVEKDADKIEEIDRALRAEAERLRVGNRMLINYAGVSAEQLKAWRKRRKPKDAADPASEERAPTRLSVTVDGNVYHFGAVTSGAAVPERALTLDPRLVNDVNGKLAGLVDLNDQNEYGQLLGKLIVPDDIQASIFVDAPIVVQVDATTARLHWEMMVPPGIGMQRLAAQVADGADPAGDSEIDEAEARFLGLARGLTRQLLTPFASVPEAPASPRRLLRALVVADTDQENRLPGAMEEGLLVAGLLDAFNDVYAHSEQRIEVRRLFGPVDATRVRVLAELVNRSYDIVHFAGHCFFDASDPAACGWVFTDGEVLSARELSRVDHMAGFVFSNACESGVTPERPGKDWDGMAPSFAEVFFARGVANFLCTAWPVADKAAQFFALRLYQGLLGLKPASEVAGADLRRGSLADSWLAERPLYIFQAVREARRALLDPDLAGGRSTWGAYQHYGNPYFRFFDPRWLERRDA